MFHQFNLPPSLVLPFCRIMSIIIIIIITDLLFIIDIRNTYLCHCYHDHSQILSLSLLICDKSESIDKDLFITHKSTFIRLKKKHNHWWKSLYNTHKNTSVTPRCSFKSELQLTLKVQKNNATTKIHRKKIKDKDPCYVLFTHTVPWWHSGSLTKSIPENVVKIRTRKSLMPIKNCFQTIIYILIKDFTNTKTPAHHSK